MENACAFCSSLVTKALVFTSLALTIDACERLDPTHHSQVTSFQPPFHFNPITVLLINLFLAPVRLPVLYTV